MNRFVFIVMVLRKFSFFTKRHEKCVQHRIFKIRDMLLAHYFYTFYMTVHSKNDCWMLVGKGLLLTIKWGWTWYWELSNKYFFIFRGKAERDNCRNWGWYLNNIRKQKSIDVRLLKQPIDWADLIFEKDCSTVLLFSIKSFFWGSLSLFSELTD